MKKKQKQDQKYKTGFDNLKYFDDEERELIESIERGEWKTVPNFEKEKKNWQDIAAYSIAQRKKKALSLRLGEGDLEIIKRKAARKGLPYQTLIASVIHQYATDQLSETTK